jgi:hypothetical protein
VTASRRLDFFIGFSSATAVLGSTGQVHYAAANAALDAVIALRQARGEAATSIAWGPWADAGMASDEFRNALARVGIASFRPEEALRTLPLIMDGRRAHVVAAKADWSAFRPFFENGRARRFLELLGNGTLLNGSGTQQPVSHPPLIRGVPPGQLLQSLEQVSPRERPDQVLSYVRGLAGMVLRTGVAQLPNPHTLAKDLGFDSLLAVEFCRILGISVGQALPQTLLFEHPTLEDVANYLCREVLRINPLERPAPAAVADDRTQKMAQVRELSDDEVLAEITQAYHRLQG